ncbi:MAG: nucleoside deaminase [Chitinophagaceae bacterium]|nr:nucleoside deaminase [Chitinophagaceae bacterium]MCB0740901.1 nucleoside deaminase [Chitinophagaceae bacterium]HQV06487.1 nucleoside deaminase [Chitinophagaceae bacterium]
MTNEYFMMQALKEARKALAEDEVPIGAVVVIDEKIIARGHNMTERLKDPTAHAEMIALTTAFNTLGSKYLPEATLFVTIEPCTMCAGAIYWSQVRKIVYGADDTKNGYKKIATTNWPFHPKAELIRGVLQEECARLMKTFFQQKR